MRQKISNKVEVGELVIISQFDLPCARLVAIVRRIDGKDVHADYISEHTCMNKCCGSIDEATPLGLFGVVAIQTVDGFAAVKVTNSVAKYRDGSPRSWQSSPLDSQRLRKGVQVDWSTWDEVTE